MEEHTVSDEVLRALEEQIQPETEERTIDRLIRQSWQRKRPLETNDRRFVADAIITVAKAEPKDVQAVAASQLNLMAVYHNLVLDQARKSFWTALGSGMIGFGLIVYSVVLSLRQQPDDAVLLSAIGGVTAEFIAAVFLYMHGKTTSQLAEFHDRLDAVQRFLLANSIISSMGKDSRDEARRELVRTIAQPRHKSDSTDETPPG